MRKIAVENLGENEVLNDLLGYEGMQIIQRNDMLNFSLDSVLLSRFVQIPAKTKKILDFGTGNAPIPLFLSTRTAAKIIGIDIQQEAVDLAIRNIKLNALEDQIKIICHDINTLEMIFEQQSADVVVSNPPFFKVGESGQQNENEYLKIARHEVSLDVEQLIAKASFVLNNNGYFALVHRPQRLIEIIELLQKHRLEPKRLQFVYPKDGTRANMILIEARKNGNPGMEIETPIIVHNADGSYRDEILKIFQRIKE
ncbi:DNA methyltransferase [Erysipelotrichaceae bacterium]|nr:DNA methyltransferase [Erysipelotrichaceae bacterium]